MTSPEPSGTIEEGRKNWLLRYIALQQKFDSAIDTALRDADEDAQAAIGRSVGKGVGGLIERSQIRSAKAAIREALKLLFGNVRGVIEDGQAQAAVSAKEAGMRDDARVLRALFPERARRQMYEDAERQRAQRNVKSVMRRVLGDSYVPLSPRVYRTEALVSGQVDRIINSHLARGASWSELSRSVSSSIKPETPGGVAYAAKRLARTEINNAYHSQSVADTEDKPWVSSVEWRLSKVHQEQGCVCERYARQKTFLKSEVPNKPHPNCMCYVVPVLDAWSDFEDKLVAGSFDEYLAKHM